MLHSIGIRSVQCYEIRVLWVICFSSFIDEFFISKWLPQTCSDPVQK